MKNTVERKGNSITVKPHSENAGQKVIGLRKKVISGQKLSDSERDLLLIAIAQALGIPV
jgi:hypothetical protein